jgi:AraC-like DNA-binding protein
MQQQEVFLGRPAPRLRALSNSLTWGRVAGLGAVLALLREQPALPLSLLRVRPDAAMQRLLLDAGRPHSALAALEQGEHAARRQTYLRELVQQARASARSSVGRFRGFADFVCPLAADEEGELFLHAASFVLEPLDWNALLGAWRERSGLSSPSAEPAFVQFVAAALERPVIDASALGRLEALALALRRMIAEPTCLEDEAIFAAADAPHTALALRVLAPSSAEAHPLKLRVEVYRAQHACREMLAGALHIEASGCDDGSLQLQARGALEPAEVAARLATLQVGLQRRFGMRIVVGVARGSAAEPATERALCALQRALREGRELAFEGDAEPASPAPLYSELARGVDRVIDAFERVALGDALAAAEDFARTVCSWANGRSGALRDQLLVALAQVAKAVARRNVVSPEVADHFIDDVSQRLERAGGSEHQLEEFRQGLLRLALFTTDGPSGLHCMRLDKTLEYLKQHCAESLRLPRVARRAGFSVPTFSRAFKRATGTSFARYLRNLRVARAEELLSTTNLSGERIAELCGFRNQHHLIRSFKQVTGLTPGAFRQGAIPVERC